MADNLSRQPAIGECSGVMYLEDNGVLTVSILAEVFEEDNENYPVFSLDELFDELIEHYTWASQSDCPKIDKAVAEAIRKLCQRWRATVDSMPESDGSEYK